MQDRRYQAQGTISVRKHRHELLDGLETAYHAVLNAKATGQDYAYWQSAQAFQKAIARAERALDDALRSA